MTSYTTATTNYPEGANTPIKRVKRAGAPTSTTVKNFILGDEWLDTSLGEWWKLANNPTSGGSEWVRIGGSGGTTPIDSIQLDTSSGSGTNPVVPTFAGLLTMTGAQVATGTVGANVIRTDSTAANRLTIEVQRSTSVAATDSTKNGVSHFNNAQFSVDGSGFVSLLGGGEAIDSIEVDAATAPGTNPVVPTTAGLIGVTGAQVAPGTIGANVIKTNSLAANAYTVQIQQTSAVASKDTTKNGVAHFNSTHFTNDQGFISLSGGGQAIDSITGDTGGAIGPDGTGNINLLGQTPASTNGVKITGSGNTLTAAMFSPFIGDFSFSSSTAGGSRIVNSSNSDNTNASSNASFNASVGGTSAGDAWFQSTIGTARSYSWGPDTSASGQPLKINTNNSASVSPSSGTNLWNMTTAGIRTMPLQPAFYAYLATPATNKTGNGAVYQLGTDALTTIFDQGSNFNTNGTFTAPVAGVYSLNAQVLITNTTIATTVIMNIVASTSGIYGQTYARAAVSANLTATVTALIRMVQGETAVVTINVNGEAANTDTVFGDGGNKYTYFSGFLVC